MDNAQTPTFSESVLAKGDELIAELKKAKESLPSTAEAISGVINAIQETVGFAVIAINDAETAE